MKSEVEVGAILVEALKTAHFEVYQEVRLGRGGSCIDVVAKQGSRIDTYELKMSFSLAVVYQAMNHLGSANTSSIVVPWNRNITDAKRLCSRLGIGLLTVWDRDKHRSVWHPTEKRWITGDMSLRFEVEPQFYRIKKGWSYEKYLNKAQQTGASAGTNRGGAWSPWKDTVANLIAYVRGRGECKLREAVANISHHYGPNTSRAVAGCTFLLEQGLIPELERYKDGKYVMVRCRH